MNVTYLKGADVTVRADGRVVGGVVAVECGCRNTVEKIEEYLTDVPVAQFTETEYYVRLRMKIQPYGAFGLNPGEVSLTAGGCRLIYSDCSVEKVKCEIMPDATVEYSVLLSAQERREEKCRN